MKNWAEDTPAFKIIHALAAPRQESGAIQRGIYTTIYSDPDVLVFEPRWDRHCARGGEPWSGDDRRRSR